MKNRGLKSSYTVAYFKVHHSTCNEAKTTNVLNRKFLRDNPLEAIVTDLTYVRVGKKWNYVCFILDLFNREILGYSCGEVINGTMMYRERSIAATSDRG
ncbi:transposase [Enterococcus faecium]|nr:transposase [Enterococcus faecium]